MQIIDSNFKELDGRDIVGLVHNSSELEDYINHRVGGVIDSEDYLDFRYPCYVIIREYYDYPPNSELYDVSDVFIRVEELYSYLGCILDIKNSINIKQ